MSKRVLSVVVFFVAMVATPSAMADFPYTDSSTSSYSDFHVDAGHVPSDLSGNETWMYSATPEPGNTLVNGAASELNGVRGAHIVDADDTVDTAWQLTTGRPDVVISVLDSGIKWTDEGVMKNVRFKIHLNRGELPEPDHAGPRWSAAPTARPSPTPATTSTVTASSTSAITPAIHAST